MGSNADIPVVAFSILLIITKELVGIMILASCPGGVTSNIITKDDERK